MNKKVVICFGRFQPVSRGHSMMFDAMSSIAKKQQADMRIYASHTQDKKKNPLKYEDKIKFLKFAFPKYRTNIIVSDSRTIFDVLEELIELGYTDIILVAGSDRVKEFQDLIKIDKFNADHENKLKSFNVISAGERDPDSDDSVEGASSTKLRLAAVNGRIDDFQEGLPSGLANSQKLTAQLYRLVRQGLGLNESINNRIEGVSKMKKKLKENVDTLRSSGIDLDTEEQELLSAIINVFGFGQHPWANPKQLPYFTLPYLIKCIQLGEKGVMASSVARTKEVFKSLSAKFNLNERLDEKKVKMKKKLKEDKESDAKAVSDHIWKSFKQWQKKMDEAAKSKPKAKTDNKPSGDYLVVDKEGKKHLPVKKNGKLDHRLMGAAHAALTKGFRGKKYEGPNKLQAISKLRALYNKEKMDWPED